MEKVRLHQRNRLHFANFMVKMSKNKRTNQIKLSSYYFFAKQTRKNPTQNQIIRLQNLEFTTSKILHYL